MDYFIDFVLVVLNLKPRPPLHLSTFVISRVISDDIVNSIPAGKYSCMIKTTYGMPVGEFEYGIGSGEIFVIALESQYRHQALEQQILIYMMHDMANAGATHIWKVCRRHGDFGRFFSGLWSFCWKDSHVFQGVEAPGYIMEIPEDTRKLPILPGIGIY